MSENRVHRKIERTPEDLRRLAEIRARFQRDKPGLDELQSSGDVTEIVSHGEYLDLQTMLAQLKEHRLRRGLSLADVAGRSGMDRSAVSSLENGIYVNPTVDTLYRYAEAIGAEIGFSVRAS